MARVGNGIGSRGPISIPPFRGATAGLLIYNLLCYFALAMLSLVWSPAVVFLMRWFAFSPVDVLHLQIWRLVTYSFLNFGFVSMIFAMMSLWYSGDFLEGQFNSRWLYGLYFASVVGAAVIAIPFTYLPVMQMSDRMLATGCWPGIFGLLVGIGYYFGDMEMNLFGVLRMKAKVMVGLYIILFSAELLSQGDRVGALLQLAGGLAGYIYCRLAPRRGMAFGHGLSERWFAVKNAFYRSKRRNAAKKFEVYMGKQGRDVRFDKDGRYVDPDTLKSRDPNDKRWMN